jgi:hypothetical protein
MLRTIIRAITSRTRGAGHVEGMGAMRHANNISVGKPEGKRQLGGPSHRWEDNIRIDLRQIRWGMNWMQEP